MPKAKKKNTKKVKLYTKRIPLPKQHHKVEIPKKAYSRKKSKKIVAEVLKGEKLE